MTLKNGHADIDPRLEKYVSRLKEPARRAKLALKDALKKTVKRFEGQAENSTTDKLVLLKKVERISNDLEVLKVLSEDEIVRYALLMINKIMPIASNPRTPKEDRLKARVTAHKPLSKHLVRLKQKLSKAEEETESELESERDDCSTKLDKVTFNNTVVLMRKDVRRAKVHIIHKLTRTIKQLRTAKGKEEKVLKNQRKAERLHKKVIHIKELTEDEISKFALSTSQDVAQLASDVKAPSTSQAMATIVIHGFVATHVKDFRTKYPDWQKIVPNLLKKKKKRKSNLETSVNQNSSNKHLTANHVGLSQESQSENELSSLESDKEDEDEKEIDKSESGIEESDYEDDKHFVDSDRESHSGLEEKDRLSNVSNNKLRKVNTLTGKNLVKSNKSVVDPKEKQKTSESFSKKCESKIQNKSNKPEKAMKRSPTSTHVDNSPVEKKPKFVDPFFVTATNEEYVTSQAPLTSEINSSSNKVKSFEPNRFGKLKILDKSMKQWERTGNEGNSGRFHRFQDTAPYNKLSSSGFNKHPDDLKTNKLVFGNRKERRKALNHPQVEEKVEKLHPSWEAKKKQSNIIPFQGKKVTFD